MAGHSDTGVTFERFIKQRPRLLAIISSGALHQRHRVEAANLRLFETLKKRLRLLHRSGARRRTGSAGFGEPGQIVTRPVRGMSALQSAVRKAKLQPSSSEVLNPSARIRDFLERLILFREAFRLKAPRASAILSGAKWHAPCSDYLSDFDIQGDHLR